MSRKPRIALTVGDPAGIGPEIVEKAAADPGVRAVCEPVVYDTPFAGPIGEVSEQAGRAAYEAGLIEPSERAKPSTPVAGTPFFDLDTPQKPGSTRG